jgi:parallel beta-helix repeat protein
MKRRIKQTALSMILFLVFELFFVINILAVKIDSIDTNNSVIIVDHNGEGDYKTIQEAVNNAKPGSTIYIKKGEYAEVITIKKLINLVGEEKDSTLINPISEKNKYAICLGAPEIKIYGLSIKNGASGLYASGIRIISPNIEINNCNIFDTPVGIVIWSSQNKIESCSFWGCADEGIALIGTQYSECNNNMILNCIFKENCDGIELQYSSNNIISNCDFYDNSHSGIDAIASSNNENIISNCRIHNNKVHGVYLSSSSENIIKDCLIFNNENGNIVTNKESKNNQLISNFNSNHKQNKLTVMDFFRYVSNKKFNSDIRSLISIIQSLIHF